MRFLGKTALGPEPANTVGIYGVVAVPERNRLFCSNLHTPWLTVMDTQRRLFVGTIALEEREQRGLMEMARHPRTGHVWVANELKHCLYVVDPVVEKQIAVVETGREPHCLDFDSKTGRLFVCCGADNAVLVLGPDHKRLGMISVGKAPWGVAVDATRRRLFVVCQGDATLWRLDLDRLEPLGRPIPLGRMPRSVAVDPKDGKALVAHRRERRLLAIDGASGSVLGSAEIEWDAVGVTIDDRYRRIYVVNRMGRLEEEIGQPATVSVIDAEHIRTLRHVKVGKISHYLALDERHAYVGNEDSLDVSVLDRERMEEIARIRGLGQTVDELVVHPANGRIYVPSHLTGEVIIADPAGRRAVARAKVGSWPSGVGIDSFRGLVYVTNMDNGTVTVLSDRDHSQVAEIDLGVGTNKIHRLWSRVAVDEQRGKIYVTLTRFHGVAVIDSATGKLVHRAKLGEDNPDTQAAYVRAFELAVAVDPETGRVYVLNGHKARLSVVDGPAVDLSALELPLERRYSPFASLAVDATRKRLFVYNWIISTQTHKVIGSLPRETATGVTAVDAGRNLIYAHGLRGLSVLDGKDFRQVAFLPLEAEPGGEPSDLRTLYAVDHARKRIHAVRHIMLTSNELETYEVNL
ncbi:MAG: YncE family protein [Acidobacteria bacterium]|nr:YncE family protein [Acidobacteriota bacterium]